MIIMIINERNDCNNINNNNKIVRIFLFVFVDQLNTEKKWVGEEEKKTTCIYILLYAFRHTLKYKII